MNIEKDAGIDIQTMVDEVVGDQLDELNVQRKTALSFCQDGKVFFSQNFFASIIMNTTAST